MTFPTDARIIAAFLILGLGALGAAVLLAYGDPANSLHVQGLGWCFTATLGSAAAIVGSNTWIALRGGQP